MMKSIHKLLLSLLMVINFSYGYQITKIGDFGIIVQGESTFTNTEDVRYNGFEVIKALPDDRCPANYVDDGLFRDRTKIEKDHNFGFSIRVADFETYLVDSYTYNRIKQTRHCRSFELSHYTDEKGYYFTVNQFGNNGCPPFTEFIRFTQNNEAIVCRNTIIGSFTANGSVYIRTQPSDLCLPYTINEGLYEDGRHCKLTIKNSVNDNGNWYYKLYGNDTCPAGSTDAGIESDNTRKCRVVSSPPPPPVEATKCTNGTFWQVNSCSSICPNGFNWDGANCASRIIIFSGDGFFWQNNQLYVWGEDYSYGTPKCPIDRNRFDGKNCIVLSSSDKQKYFITGSFLYNNKLYLTRRVP